MSKQKPSGEVEAEVSRAAAHAIFFISCTRSIVEVEAEVTRAAADAVCSTSSTNSTSCSRCPRLVHDCRQQGEEDEATDSVTVSTRHCRTCAFPVSSLVVKGRQFFKYKCFAIARKIDEEEAGVIACPCQLTPQGSPRISQEFISKAQASNAFKFKASKPSRRRNKFRSVAAKDEDPDDAELARQLKSRTETKDAADAKDGDQVAQICIPSASPSPVGSATTTARDGSLAAALAVDVNDDAVDSFSWITELVPGARLDDDELGADFAHGAGSDAKDESDAKDATPSLVQVSMQEALHECAGQGLLDKQLTRALQDGPLAVDVDDGPYLFSEPVADGKLKKMIELIDQMDLRSLSSLKSGHFHHDDSEDEELARQLKYTLLEEQEALRRDAQRGRRQKQKAMEGAGVIMTGSSSSSTAIVQEERRETKPTKRRQKQPDPGHQ